MIGRDAFDVTLDRLLAAGATFHDAYFAALRASWRGADEPICEVTCDAATMAAGLEIHTCVCGQAFRFRPGATRARCPGCGARYEIVERAAG
jgi:hypothetical protein